MTSNPTPTRPDAPREAVPCWMIPGDFRAVSVYSEDGTGKPVVETDVPALAVDNQSAGGIVARVHAAVAGFDVHPDAVAPVVARILAALGALADAPPTPAVTMPRPPLELPTVNTEAL